MRKSIILLISALSAIACGNNQQPKRIVSETPVKTNVLGIELGAKVSAEQVKQSLKKATDKTFSTHIEKIDDVESCIRAIPAYDNYFIFANMSWHYADIRLNQNNLVYEIELTSSFESVEQAKEMFEAVKAIYDNKYGKGNEEGQWKFWTDDTNSVGISYEKSSAINGNDRSFCHLYYTNISLINALQAAKQPDDI